MADLIEAVRGIKGPGHDGRRAAEKKDDRIQWKDIHEALEGFRSLSLFLFQVDKNNRFRGLTYGMS